MALLSISLKKQDESEETSHEHPPPASVPTSWAFFPWPQMNSVPLEKATCSTCRKDASYSDPLKDITLAIHLSILPFLLELFHHSTDIISPTFEKHSLAPHFLLQILASFLSFLELICIHHFQHLPFHPLLNLIQSGIYLIHSN